MEDSETQVITRTTTFAGPLPVGTTPEDVQKFREFNIDIGSLSPRLERLLQNVTTPKQKELFLLAYDAEKKAEQARRGASFSEFLKGLVPQTKEEALESGGIPLVGPSGELVFTGDPFGAIGGLKQVGIKVSKRALEILAKATNEAAIVRIIKGEIKGISDDIARAFGRKIKGVKTVEEVQNILNPPIRPLVKKGVVEPEVDPVKTIVDALKRARPLRRQQEAIFFKERAKRVARVASAGQRVKGEAGFFAQKGALKGQFVKVEFESLRGKIKQSDIDELFNRIELNDSLLPLEKVTAKGGLAKILGEGGGAVPTRGEIGLLSEVFPLDFIKAVLGKQTFKKKLLANLAEIANIPRALMATFDFSAPLRQGIFFIGRPKQFTSAFGNMFRFAFSDKASKAFIADVKKRPTYKFMKQAELAITESQSPILTEREELFMSNILEKVPIIRVPLKIANRAYTGFLNKLRVDVFEDLLKKSNTQGIQRTDKFLKDLGSFINAATGRGGLGPFERSSVVLNSLFFSPRLMASRMNLMNPYFYIQLDPFVRKEALKSLLTFGAYAGTIFGLTKLAGGEVGPDPRNADFGKAKFGNTRYDILGGFQQYIRIAAQLTSGKVISSTSGREITLGEGFKPLTRKDIVLRFFENKESPVASFITALATGRNAIGQEVDVPVEVVNRFTPFVLQDLFELYKADELKGLVEWIPAPFGVGVQTYGKQELVFGEGKLGQPTAQVRPLTGLGEAITGVFGREDVLGASRGFSVEVYYDQLSSLPANEAADVFDKIAASNPDLAKQIVDIVRDRERGITNHDKDLKAKGVQSGDRAIAVKRDLDNLQTEEEKSLLWQEYVRKGVLTEEVREQVLILLGGGSFADQDASSGVLGVFDNLKETVDDLFSGRDNKEGDILDTVIIYGEAFKVDPITAFKTLFGKEGLRKVENDAIIFLRASREFTEGIREELGAGVDVELDHIIPLQLGGTNDRDNLELVPIALHDEYTLVGNSLGRKLRAGKIGKEEAQRVMLDFRNGNITKEEALNI